MRRPKGGPRVRRAGPGDSSGRPVHLSMLPSLAAHPERPGLPFPARSLSPPPPKPCPQLPIPASSRSSSLPVLSLPTPLPLPLLPPLPQQIHSSGWGHSRSAFSSSGPSSSSSFVLFFLSFTAAGSGLPVLGLTFSPSYSPRSFPPKTLPPSSLRAILGREECE